MVDILKSKERRIKRIESEYPLLILTVIIIIIAVISLLSWLAG